MTARLSHYSSVDNLMCKFNVTSNSSAEWAFSEHAKESSVQHKAATAKCRRCTASLFTTPPIWQRLRDHIISEHSPIAFLLVLFLLILVKKNHIFCEWTNQQPPTRTPDHCWFKQTVEGGFTSQRQLHPPWKQGICVTRQNVSYTCREKAAVLGIVLVFVCLLIP